MPAVRETLIAAVAARLAAIPGVGFELMNAADEDRLPALTLDDLGHDVLERDPVNTRYRLKLVVEGMAQAAGAVTAHSAANDLYVAVVAALLTEPPLGGLAETIDEGDLAIDVSALASASTIAFALDVFVEFSAASRNPGVFA